MNTNQVIKRSALTKALVDALKGTILIGRGSAPPEGGWPRGQAGIETFVPYVVIKTGPAQTPAPGLPENDGRLRTSWMVTYSFSYHATSDSSTDDFADVGRDLILQAGVLPDSFTLDSVEWRLQSVVIPRLGATEKDTSTDPEHWRLTDDVSLLLSRVQAR